MTGRPRILIAGAGIGGLTAALALLRRGFGVAIFEQAPALREVGAGVQISANGTRVLIALGLEEALRRVAVEAEGKEVRLWSTGQRWKLFDLGASSVERYGAPYWMFHRADLHQALADAVRALEPGAIRLDARCVGVVENERGVTLALADGSHAAGDALIGADGVHSAVRAALFGVDAPRFTGCMAWRGVIPMASLPEGFAGLVGTNWIGPGGHVVHYPLRRGELFNFVGIVERGDWRIESWNQRGTIEECAADFRHWHADIHAIIRRIETPYKWALMVREPLLSWSRGRISLLGDAAHPTLPMLAQGAVMAIEDGFVLARCLASYGDVATALRHYERARAERTARIVRGAADNVTRFHNPRLADPEEAAKYVETEWREDRVRARYEWLFTYDATTVPV